MPQRIQVYVPTEPSGASEIVHDYLPGKFEDRYGGATVIPDAEGHWAGITEPVAIVETVCLDEPFSEGHLDAILEHVRAMLDQDEVLATIEEVDTITVSRGIEA